MLWTLFKAGRETGWSCHVAKESKAEARCAPLPHSEKLLTRVPLGWQSLSEVGVLVVSGDGGGGVDDAVFEGGFGGDGGLGPKDGVGDGGVLADGGVWADP